MPGSCGGGGGTRRNDRSGRRSHCCVEGRLNGNPKIDFSHRIVPSCFTFFGGTTCNENEGAHRRGLRKITLPITLRCAKTCCGSDISSRISRIIAHELMPETAMAAIIDETMMNSRLLLVLSAAIPSTMMSTM